MTQQPIAIADKVVTFDYAYLPVSDMRVLTMQDPKTKRSNVTSVLVQDEPLKATQRFWTSLYARYGFNSAFFKYFNHAEVFQRISEVEKNDRMRLCIERDENGKGTLLGVSNPTKPVVEYSQLMDMLGRYNGQEIQYHDGIVESTHIPRIGANTFKIGGDDFANRFMMSTPIDGYGKPNIYLSMMRLLCTNGAVGYSKAFRSELGLGKADDDVAPTLTRALDGFSNDEGFVALRQRFESAAKSWASVYEAMALYKLMTKIYANKGIEQEAMADAPTTIAGYLGAPTGGIVEGGDDAGVGSQLLVAFHRMTGDVSQLYGLANLDALSQKRQKTLPVKCTVYDLFNFATEVATHHAKPSGARSLQGWLGQTLSEEYDMEGTRDKFSEFKDFHISARLESGLTGSKPVVHN